MVHLQALSAVCTDEGERDGPRMNEAGPERSANPTTHAEVNHNLDTDLTEVLTEEDTLERSEETNGTVIT